MQVLVQHAMLLAAEPGLLCKNLTGEAGDAQRTCAVTDAMWLQVPRGGVY